MRSCVFTKLLVVSKQILAFSIDTVEDSSRLKMLIRYSKQDLECIHLKSVGSDTIEDQLRVAVPAAFIHFNNYKIQNV